MVIIQKTLGTKTLSSNRTPSRARSTRPQARSSDYTKPTRPNFHHNFYGQPVGIPIHTSRGRNASGTALSGRVIPPPSDRQGVGHPANGLRLRPEAPTSFLVWLCPNSAEWRHCSPTATAAIATAPTPATNPIRARSLRQDRWLGGQLSPPPVRPPPTTESVDALNCRTSHLATVDTGAAP